MSAIGCSESMREAMSKTKAAGQSGLELALHCQQCTVSTRTTASLSLAGDVVLAVRRHLKSLWRRALQKAVRGLNEESRSD